MNSLKALFTLGLMAAVFSGPASAQSINSSYFGPSNSAEEKKEEEKKSDDVKIETVEIKGQKYIRIINNGKTTVELTLYDESNQPIASVSVPPGKTEHIPIPAKQNLTLGLPIAASESTAPTEAASTLADFVEPAHAEVTVGYQASPELSIGGMDYSFTERTSTILQPTQAYGAMEYQLSPGLMTGGADYTEPQNSMLHWHDFAR